MATPRKINKVLATILASITLCLNYTKIIIYSMKPVSLGDVQGKEIGKIRRHFENQAGNDDDFDDIDDVAIPCHYTNSVELDDGKKVCFMAFNAPSLMSGLEKNTFEHIKKDEKTETVTHIDKSLRERYNIIHILACLRNDAYIMFNSLNDNYEEFNEGFKKEMDARLTKLIDSGEYDRYYKNISDFFGGGISTQQIKEITKSLIINDGIQKSAFNSAWKGQVLAFTSWLAGALCPYLLPITLPLSFKAGTMIGESDIKTKIAVEQQKLSNLESLLRQLLSKICYETERVAKTNSLLLVFDDRSDVKINDGSIGDCLKSLIVPSVYTLDKNRGSELEFRSVKNLKNAPKLIEYKRDGKNLFHIYSQVFRTLLENASDIKTLEYVHNYLRGNPSPEKLTSKVIIEEVSDDEED